MTRRFSRMGCFVPDPSRPSRWQRRADLGGLLGLLGEKHGVDVGEDAAGGDGDAAEKLVELLVVADGELEVTGRDAALLVVPGGVAGQLEDLGGEVLKDGGQVDWGAGTNSGTDGGLLDVSVDTTDWELESSSRRSRLGCRLGLAR